MTNNSHPDETAGEPIGMGRFVLLSLIFVVSGASALIYEVVWTRQLTTVFGATIYAVSTVLTAFMGGLALGSWLIGKRADLMRRPLFVFGVLELAIAASALLFPYALRLFEPLVGLVYAPGGEVRFYLFSLMRFVIAGLLLAVPTTLMGATLPVMSRALARDFRNLGRVVGGLYALNTLGAVIGVFVSGFVLLELLGVWRTTVVAAAGDAAVGLIAIAISRTLKPMPVHPAQETPAKVELPVPGTPVYTRRTINAVLVGYFLVGFAALGYQVAWTRALIFSFDTLKATTYTFAGMLTIFLLGLAIGSALMHRVVDRLRNPLWVFSLLQLLLGASGALTVLLIPADPPEFLVLPEFAASDPGTLLYWNAVGNVLIKTALAIGVPTLLMGAMFPVAARLVSMSVDRVGRDIGRVYAVNTGGAILGSFAGGFIFAPLLGLTVSILVLSAILVLFAAFLVGMNTELAQGRRAVFAGAVAVAGLLLVGRVGIAATDLRYQMLALGERSVFYEEGPLATVSVIEDSKGWRTIYVDNVGVAGTDPVLQTDQKTLAHVPMLLLGGEAENILTVGFGSGGASYSYTLYPEVQNIHAIEITTTVPKAAPHLTAANHGIVYPRHIVREAREQLPPGGRIAGSRHPIEAYTHEAAPGLYTFDPRYRIIIDDARAYLRFTDTLYDVIATDCTDLRYKTNANLYDLEYFRLCRDRITDDGMVVVWMPLAGLSDEAFRIVTRTFREVFPKMTVWYFANQPTHYCLFIGQKGGVRIDYDAVQRGLGNTRIQEDLEEIGLRNPAKVVASFVTDDRGLDAYIGDGPLNTEDFPIIEFLSPRYGYDATPIAINMGNLFEVQVPVWDLIETPSPRALEDRERIEAIQAANKILFDGHVAYRNYEFSEASRLYTEALAVAPFDESIEKLLDFEELRLLLDWELDRNPQQIDLQWINAQWIAHGLARVFTQQGRYADAVTVVMPFVRRTPRAGSIDSREIHEIGFSLNRAVAECYERTGSPERAEQFWRAAADYQAHLGNATPTDMVTDQETP